LAADHHLRGHIRYSNMRYRSCFSGNARQQHGCENRSAQVFRAKGFPEKLRIGIGLGWSVRVGVGSHKEGRSMTITITSDSARAAIEAVSLLATRFPRRA